MRVWLATALAVMLAACPLRLALGADQKDTRTIKDLESRPVPVKKDAKLDASAAKAMENYRRFLELQKTDPQLRAEAHAPPGRPQPGRGRARAHGEGGRRRSTCRAPRPSSSTRRCSRPIRITRATTRCCTSSRAPTRRRASPNRRSRRWIASCSDTRRQPADRRSAVPARRAAVLGEALCRGAKRRTRWSSRRASLRTSTSRASTSTAGRCSNSRMTEESLPSFAGVLDAQAAGASRQAPSGSRISSAPTASSSRIRCAS